MGRAIVVSLLILGLVSGCKGASSSLHEPGLPAGPAPIVSASLGFGESPVEGFLYLRPSESTTAWTYSVDVDEDGRADHQGILEGEIGFAYRFAAPGVHRIRVSLEGPGRNETSEVPVVVNDPNAVQILVQRDIDGSDPDAIFEGIAVNRAGTALFVGDFVHSRIHQLDPVDLATTGPPLELRRAEFEPRGGAEGLSITPSDSILLVAHKYFAFSVVGIPSMEIRRSLQMEGEFFIEALDETTALSIGRTEVVLVDTRTGESIRRLGLPTTRHFASHPAGRVAVLDGHGPPPTLHIVSLPELEEVGHVPLPQLEFANIVAFDPAGDRVYVVGSDSERRAIFVLIDVATTRVLMTMSLGSRHCIMFWVANPVATLAGGRYVAIEQADGVYFIDTALDLPRFHALVGRSVAASPVENEVFSLEGDGVVTKARIVR